MSTHGQVDNGARAWHATRGPERSLPQSMHCGQECGVHASMGTLGPVRIRGAPVATKLGVDCDHAALALFEARAVGIWDEQQL